MGGGGDKKIMRDLLERVLNGDRKREKVKKTKCERERKKRKRKKRRRKKKCDKERTRQVVKASWS